MQDLSKKIKRNVILKCFWLPFILIGLTLALGYFQYDFINVFGLVGVTIGLILRNLIIQQRFVYDFRVELSLCKVYYYTPFLKHGIKEIHMDEIEDIDIDKPGFFGEGELTVITFEKWHSFDLVNTQIADHLQEVAKTHFSKVLNS